MEATNRAIKQGINASYLSNALSSRSSNFTRKTFYGTLALVKAAAQFMVCSELCFCKMLPNFNPRLRYSIRHDCRSTDKGTDRSTTRALTA